MNTINSIQTTATMGPAQDLLLDGIRELSRGNELAALESFAGALDGHDALGALCTARLHLLRREHGEARKAPEDLIEREPGLAEAHYLLGAVHRASLRVFDAIRSFRETLRLDPWHSRAAMELGDLLEVQDP